MIHYFTCPACKTRIRVFTPTDDERCFWCDGGLQLPIPTPSPIAKAFPQGYVPPRPLTPKGDDHQ